VCDAALRDKLREHGVTHVVNVADDVPSYHAQEELTYLNLSIADFGGERLSSAIYSKFDHAAQFLRDQVGLVGDPGEVGEGSRRLRAEHCANGSNLSATVTIAVLMSLYQWDLARATAFVKARRREFLPSGASRLSMSVLDTMRSVSREKRRVSLRP